MARTSELGSRKDVAELRAPGTRLAGQSLTVYDAATGVDPPAQAEPGDAHRYKLADTRVWIQDVVSVEAGDVFGL
jgi:hypothetical protein